MTVWWVSKNLAEAQEFYEATGEPKQVPHRLDGDGDGKVCKSASYLISEFAKCCS